MNREDFFKMLQGGQAQGASAADQEQAKQAEQKLQEYLLGKKSQMQSESQQRELQQAQEFSKAHPGESIKIGDTSISPKDPTAMLNYLLHKQGATEKNTQHLSDAIAKAKIPEAMQGFSQLEANKSGETDPQSGEKHLGSFGSVASALPDWLVPAAETVGKLGIPGVGLPKGSSDERASYRGVQNALMHAQFGSRQTEQEAARLSRQLGEHAGIPGSVQEQALKRAQDLIQAQGKGIVAGAPPEAVQQFQQQGGMTDFTPQGGPKFNAPPQGLGAQPPQAQPPQAQPPMDPAAAARRARIMELQKKLGK